MIRITTHGAFYGVVRAQKFAIPSGLSGPTVANAIWRQSTAPDSLHGFAAAGSSPDLERVIKFTLYVAGDSYRSQRSIANLRKLGDERLRGEYDLEIIDVQRDPESAERDRILTTPTLIKRSPGNPRRVTGDLTDFEQVLIALALMPGLEI